MSVLTHRDARIAAAVQSVMHAAYSVEAEILGVTDFFPLRRTAAQIAASPTTFFGIEADGALVAVGEVDDHSPERSNVDAVVVHPAHFRRGLGRRLVQHVIDVRPQRDLTVSTGILNHPAISLYETLGFHEDRRWRTPDGIPMITLLRRSV